MRIVPDSGSMREYNHCHEPAGSPAGGQFCDGGVERGVDYYEPPSKSAFAEVARKHRLGREFYHVLVKGRDGAYKPYAGRRWGFTQAEGAASEFRGIKAGPLKQSAVIIHIAKDGTITERTPR